MNIIIVNDFAHVNGGAGQVALSSAIELAECGHRVILFAAVNPIMKSLHESTVEIITTGQSEILMDENRLRAAVQGIWNYKAQKRMDELLDTLDSKNTIIHVHSWTKALSASVLRVAIKREFKIVCTFHDYFMACPNGGFFDYKRREICSEVPLSFGCISKNCDVRNYPHKMWRVVRQVVQKKLGLIPEGISNFIVISDFSLSILKPFLPQHSSIFRINNPIRSERQECIDSGLNSAFTFVGRLSPEKGADLFARVCKIMSLTPIFVGDGALRKEIEEICPHAEITGWVSSNQVEEYLSTARALVFPSLLYEGSPLAILEAAALGIPAIVPDTCAARDLVENGRTGLWFRSGDEYDLIDKIRQLQDPRTSSRLGRAAYNKYWESPWTEAIHVKNLITCYKQILELTIA